MERFSCALSFALCGVVAQTVTMRLTFFDGRIADLSTWDHAPDASYTNQYKTDVSSIHMLFHANIARLCDRDVNNVEMNWYAWFALCIIDKCPD